MLEWHGTEVARTIKARTGRASQKIAELILAKALEEVPVLSGRLKGSGHVHEGTATHPGNPFLARAVLFSRADALRTWQEAVNGK